MRDLLLVYAGFLLGLSIGWVLHRAWVAAWHRRRRADTQALLQRLLLQSIGSIEDTHRTLSYYTAAVSELRHMLALISTQLRDLARAAPASGSTGQTTS